MRVSRPAWQVVVAAAGCALLAIAVGVVAMALNPREGVSLADFMAVGLTSVALAVSLLVWVIGSVKPVTSSPAPAGEEAQHPHGKLSSTVVVPRQLPPVVDGFVGRVAELAALTSQLDRSADAGAPVVISAIGGMAGIGKTALALHWAHRVRDHFPDGDLYVNLRGYDRGPPLAPERALSGFLWALGVAPEKVPADLDAQASLYRTLLQGRRVLVVLDNASSADQVRPALPGSPGCFVVVTSRSRLSGLIARDGARSVNLDVLPREEAIALLRDIVGKERVDAEPLAASEIVQRCAFLPLAIRIAAQRAAAHPRRMLADLAEELTDQHERLNVMAAIDDETTTVRSIFAWSYRDLTPSSARAFRLLGLPASSDFSVQAASALVERPIGEVQRTLEALADIHLLEEAKANRYTFHDLLRSYAAERATADELDHARNRATTNLLLWYLHAATAARTHLAVGRTESPFQLPAELGRQPDPQTTFNTPQQALEWCDLEIDNLVAAVRQAAETDQHRIACWIPITLRPYLQRRMPFNLWLTIHSLGLTASQAAHDKPGEAEIHRGLGVAHYYQGHYEDSLEHQLRALSLYQQLGQHGEIILVNLGSVTAALGRFEESIDHLHQALAASRATGYRNVEGYALQSLGNTYQQLDRFEDAVTMCEQALAIFKETKDVYGAGTALGRLAFSYLRLQQLPQAIEHLSQAVAIAKEIGDRPGEAWATDTLATAHFRAHRRDESNRLWRQALRIYESIADFDRAAKVRARLSDTRTAGSDPEPRP